METINDLLHLLNRLDFIGVLTVREYSNFNNCKKFLTDIFQDLDCDEVIIMLIFIDDILINFIRQNFNSKPIINNLRDKIFEIYDKEMVEERLDTVNKTNHT